LASSIHFFNLFVFLLMIRWMPSWRYGALASIDSMSLWLIMLSINQGRIFDTYQYKGIDRLLEREGFIKLKRGKLSLPPFSGSQSRSIDVDNAKSRQSRYCLLERDKGSDDTRSDQDPQSGPIISISQLPQLSATTTTYLHNSFITH
jgi:hypothetical protein